jgi:hypothetical protein
MVVAQDRWDPMLQVESLLQPMISSLTRLASSTVAARLASPVMAQPKPQGLADFEIVAGSNLAPPAVDFEDLAPIQQLPASPTLSQQGLVESSHQNGGVHDHHH